MATTSDITGNPYKVTGTTAAAEKVTDSGVMIQGFLWHGATTDGHLLSVTDKNGRQLWKGKMATTALTEPVQITFPQGLYSANGIYVNDMDSGELYIYIK